MPGSKSVKSLLFGSASLALALGGVAHAADPAPNAAPAARDAAGTTVESVLVTARRRTETLFEAAGPVTAVTPETISTFHIQDAKTVIDRVPNASIPSSPDNYVLAIYIRGIQQTDVNTQPNFGVYRNGIYNGGERPNLGSMIDLERVEVLAGPQAGLYGRDAVGGAVNVVYATPKDRLGGYVNVDYGTHERIDLDGAINIPINDKADARLAAWYIDQNKGELYNGLLNTYVDKNRHDGFRFSLKVNPVQNLDVLWVAEFDDNKGPSVEAYAPNGVRNLLGHSPPETPNLIYRNTPDINWNQQFYISQDAKYKTSIGTFQWLTSFSAYRMHDIEDGDKTGLDPNQGVYSQTVLNRFERTRNFYTEWLWFSPQIGPLELTAGLSYFNQDFNVGRVFSNSINLTLLSPYSSVACGAYLGDPNCPGIPGGVFPMVGLQTASFAAPDGKSTIGTDSFSVFGQGVLHLTKRLSITGALRYTRDAETLHFRQFPLPTATQGAADIVALFANTFPPISADVTNNYDKVSPAVQIDYRPTDTINLYALYSTGFRPGGFNTTTTSANLLTYGSESARNYEAGVKTLWLGGRLGVNLDGFLMYQDHLLEYQPDPIAPPQFFFYYLNNAGSARTYGIEALVKARLTDWWNASASLGWEKAQLTGGSSYGYPLAGGQLELTRTWTVNLETDARHHLVGPYDLIGAVNFHYESGGYLDITSIPWPDYRKLDAVVGVTRGPATLVGYINNAFDNRPPQFVYGNRATTLTPGQTYGVRLTLRY